MSAEPKPNLSAMKEPSNTKPILGKRKSTEPSCGELDSRIKRLRDSILPTSPYLLTVPSDGPPLGSSHQPNYWRKGTPFAANEERLQYLSFLAHGDGLIKAVGGWDNDKGEIMETTSKQLQSRSSGMSGSQQTQSQKKKISLSDYKTKAGGQAVTKDVTKANGTSGQRQMNGTLQTTENLAKAEKNDLILSQKRYINTSRDPNHDPSLTVTNTSQGLPRLSMTIKLRKPLQIVKILHRRLKSLEQRRLHQSRRLRMNLRSTSPTPSCFQRSYRQLYLLA